MSFDNCLTILDILLPTHYFLPYEKEKTAEEQYELYKQRALLKAKCTPIDILHKTVNFSFKNEDTVDQIFSRTKYLISKCFDSFPSEDQIDVMSWIFILKFLSKHIRSQIASDCRVPSLEKLAESLQFYASNHNKTFGSFMFELKPKHVKSVKQTQITCLSKHISVGTFSVVQLPVSTSIYTGPLEGIVVQNLLYDAILPIMKSDTVKSIRVNLSSASIDVEPHLPATFRSSLPASVLTSTQCYKM